MITCTACFADRHVIAQLGPLLSVDVGTCPVCGTIDATLFSVEGLSEQFELLYSVYRPAKSGPSFLEWIAVDWKVFDQAKIETSKQRDLIEAALGPHFTIDSPMAPISKGGDRPLARWDELTTELKEKNRYFFDQSLIDMDRLSDLLGFLLTNDLPSSWFRGRITEANRAFKLDEMGAPPGRLASHGRANPPGIPYLYLASTADTAASEIRPHTGENICIAKFEVSFPITAVDLRDPRCHLSPFILSDALSIVHLRDDIPFLEKLGEELTRPVVPKGAAIDYIPSQFLCEFIKKKGYDGVAYNSSMSDGFNFALFEPSRAHGVSCEMYSVESMTVRIKPI